MKIIFKTVFFAISIAITPLFGVYAADDEGTIVKIDKDVMNTVIPVSITGLSGEAAAVVKFDLEVLGIVDKGPAGAQYFISGSNNGNLEGRLSDINKTVLFSKAYQGGSTRLLAHTFAEDVVKALRPGLKPIFNTKIAFRLEQSGIAEICVADFDGRNPKAVTDDRTLVSTPAWAPGGSKLFYTSWKNGSPQIFEQALNTGERKIFAKHPGANYSPAISPDGRHVAMILNKGGSPNLYVCDVDGSNLKQLTQGRDDKSSPCWAPDSQQICYVNRSGRAALWKINMNGGTPKRISTAPAGGNITEPDWSPDGETIVFTSMTGGFSLFKVSATKGGSAEPLVAGEDPCWAANSRTVIFTRRENGKRVLSLLDVPTKHVKDVGQISGSVSQPSWAR